MPLNERQEELANHRHGRAIGLAGPGSGKTATVTERTRRMLSEGISPANILSVTFTNKAAKEMRERLIHVCGEAGAKVWISTFHSLCGTVLRKLGKSIGYTERMTVMDTDDQLNLVAQLARKREMEVTKPKCRAIASVINDWRERLETEDDLQNYVLERRIGEDELPVVREYVKMIHSRNQTDFSGLLSETVRLLRTNEEIRKKLQGKFRFAQIDEYQDTNVTQNEIVELLAGPEDNVLAIGDADQSVYGWRGANPEAIPKFISNGKGKNGCAIYKLGTNYRSTPEIIEVASRLIKFCEDRHEIEFKASKPNGQPVQTRWFQTPEEEANAVASNIQNLIQGGQKAKEIAVLFRKNDMSRLMEQALAKRQIPAVVKGSGSYYDRMEVKDVLSMLRFLCNPKDGISFSRIANKPARGMSDAVIGTLETFCEQTGHDLLYALAHPEEVKVEVKNEYGDTVDVKGLKPAAMEACEKTYTAFGFEQSGKTVGQIVNEVLTRTRYDEWLKAKYEEKGEFDDRLRNVNELVNSINDFAESSADVSIAAYLQSIALFTDGDDEAEENGVRLMSMHASKGLEFDVVYVIGCEQGLTPHKRAVNERPDGEGLNEERRLFYVALTRARDLLRCTFTLRRQDAYARNSKYEVCEPSPFLLEAGILSRADYEKILNAGRSRSVDRYSRED